MWKSNNYKKVILRGGHLYVLKKGFALIIGSTLLSLGINLFLVPHKILDGGTVGIGLILNYIWNLKVGLIVIILSVPIFIFAWFHNRSYFYNSLHGMLLSSFFIDLLKPLSGQLEMEALFSSVVGGILVGSGIGLMLKFDTSTGGTDFIAQFLCDKTGINVGIFIFIIDAMVISCGGLLLTTNTFILSIITILSVGIATTYITK